MEGEIKEDEAKVYEGKSKVVYYYDEDSYIIKYKDTATAFDGKKKQELSGKGVLNATISNLIYKYLEKNAIKTHLIKVIDSTSIIAKKAKIIPLEVIVRNISAGSFSKKYGVEEGTKLNNTSYEFSLKSDELGDPMINSFQATALGLATEAQLNELLKRAERINELLTDLFLKASIRLVDFKLEFGVTNQNEIILCDEISPDSCRLWDIKTNDKLDKDLFRRDLGDIVDSYKNVLKRLQDVMERYEDVQ